MNLPTFLKPLRALVAIAGVVAVSSAAADVINFDELADNAVVNNVYTGVTFSTTGGDGEVRVYNDCCAHTQPNAIGSHAGSGFNFNGDLRVTFSSAVSGLSFRTGGDNNLTGSVGVVDVFGTGGLLGTVQLIGDADGAGITEELQDLSAFGSIIAIHIRNVTDAAGLVYDTFTFTRGGRAVPEPSTLALIGLGMLGLGLARRAKSKA